MADFKRKGSSHMAMLPFRSWVSLRDLDVHESFAVLPIRSRMLHGKHGLLVQESYIGVWPIRPRIVHGIVYSFINLIRDFTHSFKNCVGNVRIATLFAIKNSLSAREKNPCAKKERETHQRRGKAPLNRTLLGLFVYGPLWMEQNIVVRSLLENNNCQIFRTTHPFYELTFSNRFRIFPKISRWKLFIDQKQFPDLY